MSSLFPFQLARLPRRLLCVHFFPQEFLFFFFPLWSQKPAPSFLSIHLSILFIHPFAAGLVAQMLLTHIVGGPAVCKMNKEEWGGKSWMWTKLDVSPVHVGHSGWRVDYCLSPLKKAAVWRNWRGKQRRATVYRAVDCTGWNKIATPSPHIYLLHSFVEDI